MNRLHTVISASRVRAGLLATLLLACANGAFAEDEPSAFLAPSTVLTTTNSAAGNAIVAFRRGFGGSLVPVGTFPTLGKGTGAGLGSQGALALSDDGRWVLAVNAGSSDITVFAVTGRGLVWRSKAPSGGTTPVSITMHDSRVFVVNGGGTANISGFRLRENGTLQAMPNTQMNLPGSNPAEIAFSNGGDMLVVTEKDSNSIAVFLTDRNGHVSHPMDQASHGAVPFGFAFDRRDNVLVTEAGGGPNGTSAVSSYDITGNGHLQVISGSVGTTQPSACWIAITRNGKLAYTANTHAGTLSSFTVGKDSSLTLLNGLAANNGSNSLPGDLALSNDSRTLYSLNPGLSEILAFGVNADGSLSPAGSISGIPASAAGLVAY